jgi:CSLREA domain-containing protein
LADKGVGQAEAADVRDAPAGPEDSTLTGREQLGSRRILAILAAAIGLSLAPAAAAQATTFTVNTTANTHTGSCPGNACSLRDAIDAANGADGNTVVLPAGTFNLNTNDDPNTFGELVVNKTMTITGAGARNTTIDANGRSRIFRATDDSGGLTLNDLTVTGGHNPLVNPPAGYMQFTPSFDREGGGIFVESPLTLNRVTVRNNSAGLGGGGIMNEPPESGSINDIPVTIDRSSIINNKVEGGTSNGQGGGLTVFGNLTMTNTTVAGNSVSNGTANEGGGVTATSGDLQLDSSTGDVSGILTFTNVTIAGNQITGGTPATNSGGGLSGDNLCCGGEPGPIFYSNLHAKNTIIGGNLVNGVKSDCALVNTTSSDHNISSDGSCGFSDAGSKQGTDPGLLALENRGGPTDTMGLSPTSAATNNGTNSGCPTIDQRGVTRPQAGTCDVGALELALPTAVTGDATNVTLDGATIHGTAGNPHIDPGTVFFQYGTTAQYGNTTAAQPLAAGSRAKKKRARRARRVRRHRRSRRARRATRKRRATVGRIGARAAAAQFAATLTGLREGTVYHYRIGSTNRDGTAFGVDRTIRILRVPTLRLLGVPRACVSRAFRFRVRTSVSRQTKLRSVRVRLDGKLIKRSKSKTTTVVVDALKLRSGRHRIDVRVTDRGGRSRVSRRAFTRCRRPRRVAPQFTG